MKNWFWVSQTVHPVLHNMHHKKQICAFAGVLFVGGEEESASVQNP